MKRLALALLLVTAVGAGVLLALNRPGADASPGAIITVDSTADGVSNDHWLTLREAMLLATGDLALAQLNASEQDNVSGTPGAGSDDIIIFDHAVFPLRPPATIALGSSLPWLHTGNDTVDGSSAGVVLDGATLTFPCFNIASDNNAIKGLEILNCGNTGIYLDPTADQNTIGGNTPEERNVISGSGGPGVEIMGGDGNVVKGNYIGTDASGTTAAPNGWAGVEMYYGAKGNIVEGNLISGNHEWGVRIRLEGSLAVSGNVVKGNRIGTDASGTAALPTGVKITGSGADGTVVQGNYIGVDAAGTAAVANEVGISIEDGAQNNTVRGNVISGNGFGVFISGSGTNSNTFKGNNIGTDASGSAAVPNMVDAVYIKDGAQRNAIGGSPGDGNLIAFNGGGGVTVAGAATTGNTISGNSIHSNGDKGIENWNGGNKELAAPTIETVGSVFGTACPNCTVDAYSDQDDEGEVYEGSTTADGDGNWTLPGLPQGPNITATATDSDGNTSEFSQPLMPPWPTPTPTATPTPTPTPTTTATPTPPAGPTRTLAWGTGWHNETSSGASTPEEAFACAAGKYAAAYRYVDGGLERYFPGRAEISNMTDLEQYDTFLILITQPVTCLMPQASVPGTTRTLQWGPGWHNEGWSGADDTAPQDAFGCASGKYAAAYRFVDGGMERFFPGRPEISNMGPLNKYDAFLILVTAPVSCTMPIAP